MSGMSNGLGGEIAVPPIPDYLEKVYWWAYLHPKAVHVFERDWLVNLILWGNYRTLCDAALAELGETDERIGGAAEVLAPRDAGPGERRFLQVACVYGDLTERLLGQMGTQDRLDVIDVAPIQLDNLQRKLRPDPRWHPHQQDASALRFADGTFDRTLLFFLLHEQPEDVRRATLAEALRVTRPGGKLVIVDYHRPDDGHLLRLPMRAVLGALEPFALDLWRHEVEEFLPPGPNLSRLRKSTYFRGLYQKIVIPC